MTLETLQVIRGEDDTLDGQPLFWSNEDGWGNLTSAAVYTDREVASHKYRLPAGKCHWVSLSCAVTLHSRWVEQFALLSRRKISQGA